MQLVDVFVFLFYFMIIVLKSYSYNPIQHNTVCQCSWLDSSHASRVMCDTSARESVTLYLACLKSGCTIGWYFLLIANKAPR